MDTVIKKISEIEAAASAVMEEANVRKKEYAKEMEEKTAAYDAQLERETGEQIGAMQRQMEADMKAKLEQQKSDARRMIQAIEQNYEARHKEYADALFQSMIKG